MFEIPLLLSEFVVRTLEFVVRTVESCNISCEIWDLQGRIKNTVFWKSDTE